MVLKPVLCITDLKVKSIQMRMSFKTGFLGGTYRVNKTRRGRGKDGVRELRNTILPPCIVYFIPQHSTLNASKGKLAIFLYKTS